jgi:multidrug efflux pump subunit AcrB
MLLAYAGLIAAAGWLVVVAPKGFIPSQDRGYAIIAVQLPGGASLARTTEVVRRVEEIALGTPGVVGAPAFEGFSGATFTQSPSAAALFQSSLPGRSGFPTASRRTASPPSFAPASLRSRKRW